MYYITPLALALLICQLAVASPGKCNKPPISMKIDFNLLPGTWYEILNSHDSGLNAAEPCAALIDLKSSNGDLEITFADYHGKTTTYGIQTPVQYNETENGGYEVTNIGEAEKSWTDQMGEDIVITETIKDEASKLLNSEMFFYTDYDSYIAQLICSGENIDVYVYSRDPYPTPEGILQITNELWGLGGGCRIRPLNPAGCPMMNDLSKYKEEQS